VFPDSGHMQLCDWVAIDERTPPRPRYGSAEERSAAIAALPSVGCRTERAFDGFSLWFCPKAPSSAAP
jgi:hypothetical protein